MLRTRFFALFALFIFGAKGNLSAQEYPNLLSPKEISTIGYWNLGEKVQYNVTKKTERIVGKKKPKTSEESYAFTLEIIDSTEHSYTFQMVYGGAKSQKNDPFFDEIGTLKSNLKILYQTDEFGSIDSLLNTDELRTTLLTKLSTLEKHVNVLTSDSIKQEQYRQTLVYLKSVFEEIENIEALFLTDILYLHGYFGFTMQLSKVLDVELLYPCIGDFVLTGKGTVTLNTIVKDADECTFTVNEKPDPKELIEYLSLIAGYFFMDERKRPLDHNLKLTMKTQNKMKMELSTGWMKKITSVSTTVIKDLKKEYRQITRTELVKG